MAELEKLEKVVEYWCSLRGQKKVSQLGEVNALMISRYALAIGDENPLYHDATFARQKGYRDVIAPPNLLPSIIEWGVGEPERGLPLDGYAKETLPLDMTGLRVMGGGEEMSFHQPLVAGTVIYLNSEYGEAHIKKGSQGAIAFLVSKNIYYDGDGNVYCECRRTLLIR